MGNYTTQNQWENDNLEIQIQADNTQPESSSIPQHNYICIKKSAIFIYFSIILLSIAGILAFYKKGASIEGKWVRLADDSFTSGMIVEVSDKNGYLEGIIISTGEGDHYFQPGLIKWENVKRIGFGQYVCFDLTAYTLDGYLTDYIYDDCGAVITISPDGKTLTLTNINTDYSIESVGSQQTWVKSS